MKPTTTTERSGTSPLRVKRSKSRKHEFAFCKGVADGFGSVGHIFFVTDKGLRAKEKIRFKKYSEAIANISTLKSSTEPPSRATIKAYIRKIRGQLSGLHLDALKIKSDYCKVLDVVLQQQADEACAKAEKSQEELRRRLAELTAEFKCTALAKVTNDR